MKKICGAITLYNPTKEELDNLSLYIKFFDSLFICNNTDDSSQNNSLDYLNECENVYIISSGTNQGLSISLNLLCDAAIFQEYDYICLLDQDSTFNLNNLNKMISFINDFKSEKVAIFSPFIEYDHKIYPSNESNEFDEVDWAITSGTFVNLKYFACDKRFDENYFIDRIEFDYCQRILKDGYKIIRYNRSKIAQSLGYPSKFLFFNYYQHSPLRNYYICRNRIYFYTKKSNLSYRVFIPKLLLASTRQVMRILFLEDRKLEKLKYILKGVIDSYNGKYGKYGK